MTYGYFRNPEIMKRKTIILSGLNSRIRANLIVGLPTENLLIMFFGSLDLSDQDASTGEKINSFSSPICCQREFLFSNISVM